MTEQQVASELARPQRSRMTGQQRRASILTAATEVFAEVGYQRGTTAAVARRIGVSEPVIFQNFGTKAALFAAVVGQAADHACAWLEHHAAQHKSTIGMLRAVLAPDHLLHIHAAGSYGALFADASSVRDEPEIEAAARAATQRFVATIAALLNDGCRTGELRDDLDTEATAWWLLSLVASHKFRHATAPDPTTVETRLTDMTLTFLTATP